MSDELSKIVLGDAAVSAIEESPSRKRFFRRKKEPQPPLTNCENCGALLHGHWCAQCGQTAIRYHRSFIYVIRDAFDEFLNLDSKFVATVGWLIVRPWHLTNRFLSGHRVQFVHPLRLYLLASVLFFFAVNFGAKSINFNPTKFDSSKLSEKDRAEIEAELKKEGITPEKRAKIEKALKLKPTPSPAVEPKPTAQASVAPTASAAAASVAPAPSASISALTSPSPEVSPSLEEEKDEPTFQFGSDHPTSSLGKWFQQKAKEKIGEHGTNLQLFMRTLISNLPYMMLVCIPLFAFVLKILYIRKHIFYIDHLIYALHIHTFAYVGVMLIGLVTMALHTFTPGLVANWIIGLLWAAFVIEIFFSIRRVYRQGWFFSIFKFFVGGFVYFIVLLMALLATFLATLAT